MTMLNLFWAVALVLALLWVLGVAASYTMGGLIHVLLVLAIAAVLVRIVMSRRVL
jgi:hypothetical protein